MRILPLSVLAVTVAYGQTPGEAPEPRAAFEVVSIKPSDPGSRGMGMNTAPGGRLTMKNVTLRFLVGFAWDLRDHQLLGAPAWLDTEHFDIAAKPETEMPDNAAGRELRRAMVRSLLIDRFQLGFHRETREMPVYALVVAKSGPKLAGSDPEMQGSMMMGRGQIEAKHMKMADLAKMLSTPLGRTVLDNTGLTGDYNFTLEWTPEFGESDKPKGAPEGPPRESSVTPEGPSLFTAIQEQLGLKLDSRKGPVEMFFIDRAEKPSEN